MKFVADLHLHSKYSRAVSPNMVLEELDRWADDKGILVLGTGDFTFPAWIQEFKTKLEPAEPGLYRLKKEFKRPTIKNTFADTRFLLSTEISSIYSRAGRTRRVHNIILAPDLVTVEKISATLSRHGNLRSDGRPILGLDSEELLKIMLGINPDIAFIPAHAWTPWFSVFGSMSGFDSLEECFGEHTKYIFAIETGLSSDPAMNWRLSKLDNITLVSNSDSHSPERLGREANVFETDLSYCGIIEAIKSNRPDKFLMTIEFFPEEGKYHFDGHRLCGIYWSPEETKKHNGRCSKCARPVTVGVVNRVDKLADRPAGFKDPRRVPFVNLVALDQIIGEALEVGPKSKAVKAEYDSLIRAFGSELKVLLNISLDDLAKKTQPAVIEGMRRVREGKIHIRPGYDGEYGEIKIFTDEDRVNIKPQATLF